MLMKKSANNYWFKAKNYGWGWYPATWQGWFILLAYIGLVVWLVGDMDRELNTTGDTLLGFFVSLIFLTTTLILSCYLTGEEPRWRWGKDT